MLLGIAVPGLGQFLAGRAARGIAALATTSAALALGAFGLGQRFVSGELTLPKVGLPVSLPESFGLLPFLVVRGQFRDGTPDLERLERLPIPGEHPLFFLAALGGMLALFWTVDLLWLRSGARRAAGARAIPPLAAALTWLLPGSGHWLSGQKDKALLLGAAVIIMFVAGLALSAGHAVDRGLTPIWWAGQNLFGGGTLVAAFTTSPLVMKSLPEYRDLGIILCTVAGLMNVMVMTDAYTVAEGTSKAPDPVSGEVAA
ncbi:MAG: hypothetical protein IPM29_21755 [Planctomycetes bacterium]|nr:hypothetical protein [Planctomycetota bacterium]